jgi:indolepyruvate ferredoxin oxidoreductase
MAAAGIGCHGMALSHGPDTSGITHMGGEGRAVGRHGAVHRTRRTCSRISATAPFFHSGSLAIRQAIAAGTNVTYKILYNSAGGHDRAARTPPAPCRCPR